MSWRNQNEGTTYTPDWQREDLISVTSLRSNAKGEPIWHVSDRTGKSPSSLEYGATGVRHWKTAEAAMRAVDRERPLPEGASDRREPPLLARIQKEERVQAKRRATALHFTEAHLAAIHQAIDQFVENEQDFEATGEKSKHLAAAREVLDMFTARLAALCDESAA